MARPSKAGEAKFELPPLDLQDMTVQIVGDTPLIVHAWSQKAKGMMLAKQTKAATRGREAKDPNEDFLASSYRLADGLHGIPAVGIKNAAVTACTSIGGITKVAARQAFFIMAERAKIPGAWEGAIASNALVRLLASGPPIMREDLVRVGMGVADLRYRAEYWPWACEFVVRFNKLVLSPEQIINLLDTAGFAVGLHEWRPERDGDHGQFHVAREQDEELLSALHHVRDEAAEVAELPARKRARA